MFLVPPDAHFPHHSGWPWISRILRSEITFPDHWIFDTYVDYHFRQGMSHYRPWFGCIHHCGYEIGELMQLPQWRRSVPYCMGLFVFCQHQADYIRASRLDPPIHVIVHPIFTDGITHFDVNWYLLNLHKTAYLVGTWMRNVALYEKLEIIGHDKEHLRGQLRRALYDHALARNVVVLLYHDVAASNALLECIVRNTPCLVTRLPAVEALLGPAYPMYYDKVVMYRGTQPVIYLPIALIEETWRYLSELPKNVHPETIVRQIQSVVWTMQPFVPRPLCQVPLEIVDAIATFVDDIRTLHTLQPYISPRVFCDTHRAIMGTIKGRATVYG